MSETPKPTELEQLEAMRRYTDKHETDPDFKIILLGILDEHIEEEKLKLKTK